MNHYREGLQPIPSLWLAFQLNTFGICFYQELPSWGNLDRKWSSSRALFLSRLFGSVNVCRGRECILISWRVLGSTASLRLSSPRHSDGRTAWADAGRSEWEGLACIGELPLVRGKPARVRHVCTSRPRLSRSMFFGSLLWEWFFLNWVKITRLSRKSILQPTKTIQSFYSSTHNNRPFCLACSLSKTRCCRRHSKCSNLMEDTRNNLLWLCCFSWVVAKGSGLLQTTLSVTGSNDMILIDKSEHVILCGTSILYCHACWLSYISLFGSIKEKGLRNCFLAVGEFHIGLCTVLN